MTTFAIPFADALCSALPAGILSFASPRKSGQKEGDPYGNAPLRGVPCATHPAGRLRNSARWASDSACRIPPADLRCSASAKVPRNTPRSLNAATLHFVRRTTQALVTAPHIDPIQVDRRSVFNQPSASSSSAERAGVFGLHGLSRRRVHASRPLRRAAQSTRLRRATKRARLFFAYFILAKQKKVSRRSTAKNSANYEAKPVSHKPTPACQCDDAHPKRNSPC